MVSTKDAIMQLQPMFGAVLAQLLLGEKLRESKLLNLRAASHPQTILSELFTELLQNYYTQDDLSQQREEFIKAVIENQDTKVVTFKPQASPQQILEAYVTEIHGPKIGPKLLEIKAGELGVANLDQYDEELLPAVIAKLIRATTAVVSDENYRQREKNALINIYGEETGLRLYAFTSDMQNRFTDFLAMLFSDAASKVLVSLALGRNSIENLYTLPIAKQLDLCFRVLSESIGDKLPYDNIKETKQVFVSFLHEDIMTNPRDEVTEKQRQSRTKFHDHLGDARNQVNEAIIGHIVEELEKNHRGVNLRHLIDLAKEHEPETLEPFKDRYGRIVEVLGGPIALREFLAQTEETKQGPVYEEQVLLFFNNHIGDKEKAQKIINELKQETQLDSFVKADDDQKREFLQLTMLRQFGQVSIQRRSVIENALGDILNLKRKNTYK